MLCYLWFNAACDAVANAVADSGFDRVRALVTIAFFRLDDPIDRKNLFIERAIILIALFPQLEIIEANVPGPDLDNAKMLVEGFQRMNASHANCARSFVKLFEADKDEARNLFFAASAFFATIS